MYMRSSEGSNDAFCSFFFGFWKFENFSPADPLFVLIHSTMRAINRRAYRSGKSDYFLDNVTKNAKANGSKLVSWYHSPRVLPLTERGKV